MRDEVSARIRKLASASSQNPNEKPGHPEEARAISGAGELGTHTDVPHDTGRELIAQAKFRADDIRLATMDGLLGKWTSATSVARVNFGAPTG